MSRIAQIRRQELLAATLTVIANKGLSGVTIRDIAREAGCSFGVVAFHFETKENLLLSALNSLVEEYDETWERTARMRTGSEAAAELQARIEADFDPSVTSLNKLGVWAAFWAEASRVQKYKEVCGKLKKRYRREVARLVQLIATEHGHGAQSIEVAAGLNALVDGFWIYGHVTGEFGPSERARARQACLLYLRATFPDFFPPKGDRTAYENTIKPGERSKGASHKPRGKAGVSARYVSE